jgi:5-methylcytosine-specific restriction endonuclease McrA
MPHSSKLENCKEEVIAFYLLGKSLTETGEQFGVSYGCIQRLLVKYNVPRRELSEANILRWCDGRKEAYSKRLSGNSLAPSAGYSRPYRKKPSLLGENNPSWNGGKTPLNRLIRTCDKYAAWRMSVFRRDNFSCVLCWKKSKKNEICIHADHIIPLFKIMDEYAIKTFDDALACSLLWNIENGRTLCQSCHEATDTYGNNRHRKT